MSLSSVQALIESNDATLKGTPTLNYLQLTQIILANVLKEDYPAEARLLTDVREHMETKFNLPLVVPRNHPLGPAATAAAAAAAPN